MNALRHILVASFLFIGMALSAQTPIGVWKTIDDETGKEKSHVEIYEDDGVIYAKIVKLIDQPQDKTCDNCKGDLKDEPLVGMIILSDMTKDGSEWSGGKIMDPSKGKSYNCEIWLEGDDTLKVRGYWGFFYRTQTWHRVK